MSTDDVVSTLALTHRRAALLVALLEIGVPTAEAIQAVAEASVSDLRHFIAFRPAHAHRPHRAGRRGVFQRSPRR